MGLFQALMVTQSHKLGPSATPQPSGPPQLPQACVTQSRAFPTTQYNLFLSFISWYEELANLS